MEDDDNSDDDIGKPGLGLNYDSDGKDDDEELVPNAQSELIDLNGSEKNDKGNKKRGKAAANIPKLSGPNWKQLILFY